MRSPRVQAQGHLPLLAAPDPDGYGMGLLSGDKGHGYLSGGGVATGEIRIDIEGVNIVAAGGTTTATATIVTTGSQSNFSMLLQYEPDPYGGEIATTDAAGFVEGGWGSIGGESYQNTFTRASLPPGTYVITFAIGPLNLNPSRGFIVLFIVTGPSTDQLPASQWTKNPDADSAGLF